MFQTTEQNLRAEKNSNEMKVSNLPDKEYKDRVIKMLTEQDEMVGWCHQRDGCEFE